MTTLRVIVEKPNSTTVVIAPYEDGSGWFVTGVGGRQVLANAAHPDELERWAKSLKLKVHYL